jgi:outer membrane protein OmpA-like peptidoglycan-associated protein
VIHRTSNRYISRMLMGVVIIFIGFLLAHQRLYGQYAADTTIFCFFETNKFEIRKNDQLKIDSFVQLHPSGKLILIKAYADTVGANNSNQLLSRRRGNAVIKYFQEKHSSYLINALPLYFGEDSSYNQIANEFNRRVEIRLQIAGASIMASNISDSNIIKRLVFDNIQFVPDRAIIEPHSFYMVDKIANQLKQYDNVKFEIRGHVNFQERADDNNLVKEKMYRLSYDRATLMYELLKERGIASNRMMVKGMGNSEMIYPQPKSEAEARKNMRVEILVRRE